MEVTMKCTHVQERGRIARFTVEQEKNADPKALALSGAPNYGQMELTVNDEAEFKELKEGMLFNVTIEEMDTATGS